MNPAIFFLLLNPDFSGSIVPPAEEEIITEDGQTMLAEDGQILVTD